MVGKSLSGISNHESSILRGISKVGFLKKKNAKIHSIKKNGKFSDSCNNILTEKKKIKLRKKTTHRFSTASERKQAYVPCPKASSTSALVKRKKSNVEEKSCSNGDTRCLLINPDVAGTIAGIKRVLSIHPKSNLKGKKQKKKKKTRAELKETKNIAHSGAVEDDLHVVLTRASQSCGHQSVLSNPDLLIKVLFSLSVPDLCRLRVACKSFNDLLCSQRFWQAPPVDSQVRLSCSGVLVVRQYDIYYSDYEPNLNDFFILWNAPSSTNSSSCNGRLAEKDTVRVNATDGSCNGRLAEKDTVRVNATDGNTGKLVPLLTAVPKLSSLIHDLEHYTVPYAYEDIFYSRIMVASDGGLMCFLLHTGEENDDLKDFQILVVNPITGTAEILPPALAAPIPEDQDEDLHLKFLQFRMNGFNSYNVMLVYDTLSITQLYDSKTGLWSCTTYVCGNTLSLRKIQTGMFMYEPPSFDDDIFVYDTESGKLWTLDKACIPKYPVQYTYEALCSAHRIFRHKGRIFYAATFRTAAPCIGCNCSCHTEDPCVTCSCKPRKMNSGFGVWELVQPEEGGVCKWMEVAKTPRKFWPQSNFSWMWHEIIAAQGLVCATYTFYYHNYGDICYMRHPSTRGVQDLEAAKKIAFSDAEPPRPLVYDIDADSWYLLPGSKHEYVPYGDGVPVCCIRPFLNPNV